MLVAACSVKRLCAPTVSASSQSARQKIPRSRLLAALQRTGGEVLADVLLAFVPEHVIHVIVAQSER
jgi:hypothetical protein